MPRRSRRSYAMLRRFRRWKDFPEERTLELARRRRVREEQQRLLALEAEEREMGKEQADTECPPLCYVDEWYAPITEDLSDEDSEGELATPCPKEGPGLCIVPDDAPANHLRGEAEDPAHAELTRANPNVYVATRLRRRN